MERVWQDLRYGIRTLAKSPGFTIVAVLTLALGMGANTAIFSVVQNVLLQPLPYPQPERLVEIYNTYMPHVPKAALTPGDYDDWQREARTVTQMAAYADVSRGANLTGDGEPERVLVGYGSASLFPVLGVRMAAGRGFAAEEDKAGSAPAVILTHRLWQRRFGADPSVIGKTITLDNRRYTVVGALPATFNFLRWPEVWMPLGQFDDDLSEHVHHAFLGVARLKAGVAIAQARAEFESLHEQETATYPESHKGFGVGVERLQDPAAVRMRQMLLMLFAAVGLVLLIACVNIVNLLLVRNAAREREIAVRTALGANPWQLTRQLLTESLVLSGIGGAIGLGLAFVGLKILLAFTPGELSRLRDTQVNGEVLAFTATICLISGLACGALPAMRAMRTNLANVLKQGGKSSGALARSKTHNLLVVFELAMALLPLVGAGLLLRSLQHLLRVDPGFQTESVLTMEVPQAEISFQDYNKLSPEEQSNHAEKQSIEFELIADEIRGLPGVKAVGGIDDLPLGTEFRQALRFVIEGHPVLDSGARPVAQVRTVSLGYFRAVGIPLLAGRLFTPEDWKTKPTIINDAMARRYFPKGDALGKRIDFCSLDEKRCWYTVVGIVGNVHQFGLQSAPTYDVYFAGGWTPYLVIHTVSDPTAIAAAATALIHKTDPMLPVAHIVTMHALLSDAVSPQRFAAALTGIFAALALVLAAVGVYGVMSYTVSQRTQEIGIRMALGAQPKEVQRMILAHTLKLTVAGVAVGVAGALALARLVSSLLFGVTTYDPVTFVAVPVLLGLVALLASYVPARRALRVDPLIALRHE